MVRLCELQEGGCSWGGVFFVDSPLKPRVGHTQNPVQFQAKMAADIAQLMQHSRRFDRAIFGGPALPPQPAQDGQAAVPAQPAVIGLVDSLAALTARFERTYHNPHACN
jgi:hypothetical protein